LTSSDNLSRGFISIKFPFSIEVADENPERINKLNIKRSGLEASLRHDEYF
jgi:hypothetical protein